MEFSVDNVKSCFLYLRKLRFIPQVSGYISRGSPFLPLTLDTSFCNLGEYDSVSIYLILRQKCRQPPAYVYNQKCQERPQPSLKTLITVIYIYTIQLAKRQKFPILKTLM